MSANVTRPGDTCGGFIDALSFNIREEWVTAGLIPGINTISATIRLVGNVALALLNTIKVIVYTSGLGRCLFSKEACSEYADDSKGALIVNIAACAFSVFEAIPIVGNIPYWVLELVIRPFCAEAAKKPYYGFFGDPDKDKVRAS